MVFNVLMVLVITGSMAAGMGSNARCEPERGAVTTLSGLPLSGQSMFAVDVDGDSKVDIVSGSWVSPSSGSIGWFKNTGSGMFASYLEAAAPSTIRVMVVAAGKIDADLDTDLVFSGTGNGVATMVAWVENTAVSGDGSTWAMHQVSISGSGVASGVALQDLNGDNHLDLAVSFYSGSLLWFANDGTGVFAQQNAIASLPEAYGVAVADIDGDGDIDVVGAAANAGVAPLVWHANNGSGSGWTQMPVGLLDGSGIVTAVAASDLDGDGDVDLVVGKYDYYDPYAPDSPVFVFENTDGSGLFGKRHQIATFRVEELHVSDMNSDGKPDVLIGTNLGVSFLESTGSLMFGAPLSVSDSYGSGYPGAGKAVTSGDWNQDGKMDSAFVVGVHSIATLSGANSFASAALIATGEGDIVAIATVDLDSDGFGDVVSLTVEGALVYFSQGGLLLANPASVPLPLPPFGISAGYVRGGDVDGDGDYDVVCVRVSYYDTTIWVLENVDGSGTLIAHSVATVGIGQTPVPVHLEDMDGDGDLDIVVGAADVMLVNSGTAGGGGFPTFTSVPVFGGYGNGIGVADINGDGTPDLVRSSQYLKLVEWRPVDAAGGLGATDPVATRTDMAIDVCVGDFDGDGDVDVATSWWSADELVWYANDGTGVFGSQIPVDMAFYVDNAFSSFPQNMLLAGDVTGDHKVEIVALNAPSLLAQVAVYENTDPGLAWTRTLVFSSPSTTRSSHVFLADFDGDNNLDVMVSADAALHWANHLERDALSGSLVPREMVLDLGVYAGTNVTIPFELVDRALSELSRCSRRDTLVLPQAVYGCRRDSHRVIANSVRIQAAPGATPVFACDNGVLFLVVEGGDLELVGLRIENTGISEKSSRGAPGLRAEGKLARLGLVNSTLVGGTSTLSSLVSSSGLGGCVLAVGGGSVDITGSVLQQCVASTAGGAAAVTGSSLDGTLSRMSMVDSVVSDCLVTGVAGVGGGIAVQSGGVLSVSRTSLTRNSVAGNGGALSVLGGTATVSSSTIAANTAGRGGGGGLAVLAAGLCNVTASRVENNTAVFGGAIFAGPRPEDVVAADSAADVGVGSLVAGDKASVGLDSVVMVRNVGTRWGGGVYACQAEIDVSGQGSMWAENVALLSPHMGSSADAFVCAVAPGEPFTPDRSVPTGIPWISMAPDVFASVGTGWHIHGPIAALAWVENRVPESEIETGGFPRGTVELLDWFGSKVEYVRAIAQTTITSPALVPVTLPPMVLSGVVSDIPNGQQLRVMDTSVSDITAVVGVVVVQTRASAWPVSELTADVTVTPCGVGRGASTQTVPTPSGGFMNATTCVPCVESSESLEISFAPCVAFGECPANTVRNEGSECLCERGFWVLTGTSGVACEVCPVGGECSGGLARPSAAVGYFPKEGVSSTNFVECGRIGCLRNGECATGYHGYMCSACEPGYYSVSEVECAKCPSAPVARIVAASVALVVLAGVVAFFISWSSARAASRAASRAQASTGLVSQEIINGFRIRSLPTSLGLITVTFQVVGIISEAELAWSPVTFQMLTLLNVFNIDSRSVAAECALTSWHTAYLVSLLVSFVFLLLVVCGVMAIKVGTRMLMAVRIRNLLDTVLFTVAPLLYIPISKSALVLLDCSTLPNGDAVLDVDNGVPCYDSAWWRMFPVCMVVVILFVVGVPAYIGLSLWAWRDSLFEPDTIARFGSVYRMWRHDWWWGEVAQLGKRLLIVLTALFLSKHPLLQIVIFIAIFVSALSITLHSKPMFLPFFNMMDARLTGCTLAVLLVGMASYSNREHGKSKVLDVAGVVAIVLLCLAALHAFATDMLSLVAERRSPAYGASKRRAVLATNLEAELRDIEANDALRAQANVFLGTLTSVINPDKRSFGGDESDDGDESSFGGDGGDELSFGREEEGVNLSDFDETTHSVTAVGVARNTKFQRRSRRVHPHSHSLPVFSSGSTD